MKKKNGEINFLRFVFAVIVLILHFGDNYNFSWFRQGYIGVEFYFLVSGFLMAKHVSRLKNHPRSSGDIANATWKFIINKIKSFFPYYLCVILLWLVVLQIILRNKELVDAAKMVVRSLPTVSLTFIGLCHDYTGLYVGNTWYLSAMVIAMFLLYPMLLKQYEFHSKITFPVISVFILGYLYKTYHSVCTTFEWNGFCYEGLLRGIAEIALGVSLCRLSEYLSERFCRVFESRNVPVKLLLTAVKWLCYGIVFRFAWGHSFGGNFTIHALLYCAIAVTLSFSNVGYMIPDCKITRYLGKIALPIYIFHGLLRWICRIITGVRIIPTKEAILMIVASIIVSVVLMYLVDLIRFVCRKLITKRTVAV